MRKLLLFAKPLAGTVLIAAFFLSGCSKNASEPVVPESSLDASARASSNDPNDKAFDKEMSRILKNMQQQLEDMEMSGDPDIDFAKMMSMHHQAGIEVSEAQLKYGHDDAARELAQKSKKGNMESKARLQAFLAQHPTPEKIDKNVYQQFVKETKTAMRTMIQSFRRVPNTPDVDVDFARKLAQHHKGALSMSNVVINYSDDRMVLDEAKSITLMQSMELNELAEYVNKHGVPQTEKSDGE